MFGTPANRQFESPKNKVEFSLTENAVKGISETVKPPEPIICSQTILPDARAALRDREVRTAPGGPHNAALVSGNFFALTAREGSVL